MTTLLAEFNQKATSNDNTDSKHFNKMQLFIGRTIDENKLIIKIANRNTFPTDGEILSNLYTNNSGFRIKWKISTYNEHFRTPTGCDM